MRKITIALLAVVGLLALACEPRGTPTPTPIPQPWSSGGATACAKIDTEGMTFDFTPPRTVRGAPTLRPNVYPGTCYAYVDFNFGGYGQIMVEGRYDEKRVRIYGYEIQAQLYR